MDGDVSFHFSRILRCESQSIGFTSNFTIYDSSDSKSLIKSIVKEMQLDDKTYKPGLIQARISNAKITWFFPMHTLRMQNFISMM